MAAGSRSRRSLLGAAVLALAWAPAVQAQGAGAPRHRDAALQALQRDDPHALRTALLRGADPNVRDELGTPLVVAAARLKAWQSVRALAELRGTDLDATSADGVNALMFAALHGELPVVKALIARGAEVNKTGWTPLHWAAANGHAEVVRHLLERHAYIDAESPNQTTPLMMAARQLHPTTVRLLIDEGADPTVRNQSGLTAAEYARLAGDPKLAELLAREADAFRRRHGAGPAR